MRIALIGYGKMGQIIERIAEEKGHVISWRIRSVNADDLARIGRDNTDVAIEFTRPEAALNNVLSVLSAGVPVVCGTTGWNESLLQAKESASKHRTAFLHASNFSIGVNLFFEINKLLASLMNAQPGYDVSMEEIHHTQKKDAPSGTAITLAEQILAALERKKSWSLTESSDPSKLQITAKRIDEVPGTHSIKYHSAVDDIEIIHTAHNREGFARGAVAAAGFISTRQGIFSMADVLGISHG